MCRQLNQAEAKQRALVAAERAKQDAHVRTAAPDAAADTATCPACNAAVGSNDTFTAAAATN